MPLKISRRRAKKNIKTEMRRMGLRHLYTRGRTFIIAPNPKVLCLRWYHYTAASVGHPYLDRLIQEGMIPIPPRRQR